MNGDFYATVVAPFLDWVRIVAAFATALVVSEVASLYIVAKRAEKVRKEQEKRLGDTLDRLAARVKASGDAAIDTWNESDSE